jgi:hypothetical protein
MEKERNLAGAMISFPLQESPGKMVIPEKRCRTSWQTHQGAHSSFFERSSPGELLEITAAD